MKKIFFAALIFTLFLTSCKTNPNVFNLPNEKESEVKTELESLKEESDLDTDFVYELSNDNVNFKKINFGSEPRERKAKRIPLSWYVITSDDEGTYLLSERVLDYVCFNQEDNQNDYMNSYIREYLNNDMIEIFFNEDEKKRLLPVSDNTGDRATLMSENNLINFFGDVYYRGLMSDIYNNYERFNANLEMVAYPTEYAKSKYKSIDSVKGFDNEEYADDNGVELDERFDAFNGCTPYWILDGVDADSSLQEYVLSIGYIHYIDKIENFVGVRPLIKIKK